MSEFEYEVKFYGNQWVATVICYHELDSDKGGHAEIVEWAETLASQCDLKIGEYHEVKVIKTGELK